MADHPTAPSREMLDRARGGLVAYFDQMRDAAVRDIGPDIAVMIDTRCAVERDAYRRKVLTAMTARRDSYAVSSPEWKAFNSFLMDLVAAEAKAGEKAA